MTKKERKQLDKDWDRSMQRTKMRILQSHPKVDLMKKTAAKKAAILGLVLMLFSGNLVFAQSSEVLADLTDPMFLPVLNEELRKREEGAVDNSISITNNTTNITNNTIDIEGNNNSISINTNNITTNTTTISGNTTNIDTNETNITNNTSNITTNTTDITGNSNDIGTNTTNITTNTTNVGTNTTNIGTNTTDIGTNDGRITVLEAGPAFNSGFFTLAANTLATKVHGIGFAPTRVTITIKGETGAGTPNGGNPTFTTAMKLDTNGNGLSVDWDGTNVYVEYNSFVSRLLDDGGTPQNVNTSVEIKIDAFDV